MLPLSHEYLGDMLGVNRSSLSVVAQSLRERKLIEYTRGKIYLLDLPGLEKLACECYRTVRDHLANHAEYGTRNREIEIWHVCGRDGGSGPPRGVAVHDPTWLNLVRIVGADLDERCSQVVG